MAGRALERPWLRSWPEGVPKTIDYPTSSVAGILAKAAKESPEAVATQFYGARLTYREIDAAASEPDAEKLPVYGAGAAP